MRIKVFRALGWSLVIGAAAFLLAIALEGEWHAARGHNLFLQKRHQDASYHLAKVAERPTVYGWVKNLDLRRYHAQALLVLGRTADAFPHYLVLSQQQARDPTFALVMALYEWEAGKRSEAANRLGAALSHGDACSLCKITHQKFAAAILAQAAIKQASQQKEEALRAMVLPAQCLCYKAATIAGGMAAGELLNRIGGILDKAIDPKWLQSIATKEITEKIEITIRSLLHKALKDAFDQAAQRVAGFQSDCRPRVELSTLPILQNIDMLKTMEGWADLLPYVKDSKHLMAAAQELHGLVTHGVSFASAYLSDISARGEIATATDHVKVAWKDIARGAVEPEFTVVGLKSVADPPQRPWYSRLLWWN